MSLSIRQKLLKIRFRIQELFWLIVHNKRATSEFRVYNKNCSFRIRNKTEIVVSGPGTWFGYHDTWVKYVECDVQLPGSEKLYCVEMPQPWVWFLALVAILVAVCSCMRRCCCGESRRYEAVHA